MRLFIAGIKLCWREEKDLIIASLDRGQPLYIDDSSAIASSLAQMWSVLRSQAAELWNEYGCYASQIFAKG